MRLIKNKKAIGMNAYIIIMVVIIVVFTFVLLFLVLLGSNAQIQNKISNYLDNYHDASVLMNYARTPYKNVTIADVIAFNYANPNDNQKKELKVLTNNILTNVYSNKICWKITINGEGNKDTFLESDNDSCSSFFKYSSIQIPSYNNSNHLNLELEVWR